MNISYKKVLQHANREEFESDVLIGRVSKLETALSDLLDQIDSLEGIEFTRDIDRYKAEANWDSVLDGARAALAKVQHG